MDQATAIQHLISATYSVTGCEEYKNYSGRGMYGGFAKAAITLENTWDVAELDNFLQDVSDGDMSTATIASDSLGMGMIFYIR